MKELIQEAAEKYYWNDVMREPNSIEVDTYISHVTHYESLMRAAGYEWVKVDGDDNGIALELGKEYLQGKGVDTMQARRISDTIKKALAIGREQGRKEIKVEGSGDDAVSAEKSTLLQNNTCFYESDNTTAMNCKHCGKPKFYHNQ